MIKVWPHIAELFNDERAKADVRQRMLTEELDHRVENIIARIGAIVASLSFGAVT